MRHPAVELACVTSRGNAGMRLEEVFPRFQAHKYSGLQFAPSEPEAIVASGAKCAFLALPHRHGGAVCPGAAGGGGAGD